MTNSRPIAGSRGGDLTDKAPFKGLDLDSWDGYVVARAWYSYSQEPIPDADELPGSDEGHHRSGPPARSRGT